MTTPVMNLDPISQVHGALVATRDELRAINEKLDGHSKLFHGNGEWRKGVFGQLQVLELAIKDVGDRVGALKQQLEARAAAAEDLEAERARGRWQVTVAVIAAVTSVLTVAVPPLVAWISK